MTRRQKLFMFWKAMPLMLLIALFNFRIFTFAFWDFHWRLYWAIWDRHL